MNRDAMIATVIGFGIGLVITAIFLIGPNFAKYMPKFTLPAIAWPKVQRTQAPTPTPEPLVLTIDAPLPESIESNNEVLVSGTSQTDSLVVIEGPLGEVITHTNGDNKYAGKVTLVEGKNEIIVTSYVGEDISRQTVIVFYTPENL